MKYYEKIPFSEINNIESYVEEKLRDGHVIIQILVNEDKKEIDELISYANDKDCKSYYRCLTDSDEQLRSSVISEYMQLYYAFKDEKRDSSTCDIDIGGDRQDVIDFHTFKKDFKDMEKYYSGKSFHYENYDGKTHYEFYVSTGNADVCEECNIGNIGGYLEVEFATEWMAEQGYYQKSKRSNV